MLTKTKKLAIQADIIRYLVKKIEQRDALIDFYESVINLDQANTNAQRINEIVKLEQLYRKDSTNDK